MGIILPKIGPGDKTHRPTGRTIFLPNSNLRRGLAKNETQMSRKRLRLPIPLWLSMPAGVRERLSFLPILCNINIPCLDILVVLF